MKKIISTLIFSLIAVVASISVNGATIFGDWKSYSSFDNSVVRVVDTPTRAYFMGYNRTLIKEEPELSIPDCSLYYLDKESDEIVAAASRHNMVATDVRYIEYNPFRKYLIIVYADNNIDLLFDSGEIYNVAALKHANMPGSKDVRYVSFDPKRNIAWIATDFGYLAIDDKKMEVAESRNYSTPLDCITAIGDKLFIACKGDLYSAGINDARSSISEYTKHSTTPAVMHIFPLADNCFLLHANAGTGDNMLQTYFINNDGTLTKDKERQGYYVFDYGQLPDKAVIATRSFNVIYSLNGNKTKEEISYRPSDDVGVRTCSSWDQKEFFTALPRKGIRSAKVNSDKTPIVTRDYAMPNAPSVYISRAMAYHPRYGALVNNHGIEACFNTMRLNDPILLSGLKDGRWTRFAPAYTNPAQTYTGFNPDGLVVDNIDDKYVWMGSIFSGITRLNLDDPEDILHYSFPGDPTASLPGYVETNPIQETWKQLCQFSNPGLDADGTLWALFNNRENPSIFEFRYLTAADRKASKNAASARPFKKLITRSNGDAPAAVNSFLPLKSSVNRNMLIFMDQSTLFVINHQGTPDNTSDDKVVSFKSVTDQDGGKIDLYSPRFLYEDQETGIVWHGNASGLYYMQPRNLLQGQAIMNRVKISRNDGTSYADYLLSGVPVNSMTADENGRKWIGTVGAGIVVTSSDCKKVLCEFTSDNSDLISDNIYQLQYIPSTNSIMISTDKGLCEFFIGGSAERPEEEKDAVRAFPNPVAPDYYGWVTIDGLPENALVKIVDSTGSLVRELGRAEAGSVQWDVYNMHHQRVRTGVYYILATSADGGKESRMTKILVMN